MIRRLTILLLLLATFTAASAQDAGQPDAEGKFLERAERSNKAIAETLAKLGAECLRLGLNVAAREHLEAALAQDPQNERANKAMGRERKRVEGEWKWQEQPGKALPAADAPDVSAATRQQYQRERDKAFATIAKELIELAQDALRSALEAHARAAFEAALRYQPENETALKGAGWKMDGGHWISPREAAMRGHVRKALDAQPETEELPAIPAWAAGLGHEQAPVAGVRSGRVTVYASGGLHREALRHALAAQALASQWLGENDVPLVMFLSADRQQHEAYAKARRPGAADQNIVVGQDESCILRDADDIVTMERIVFAAAVHEVRARCGLAPHIWFEIAFATNLTWRLCGRVSQAPNAGKSPDVATWRKALTEALQGRTHPVLDKLLVARDPNEEQVICAHFFAQYLLLRHAASLESFCRAVKALEPMDDALHAATQIELPALEASFHAWLRTGR